MVDQAVFRVCGSCRRLGTPVTSHQSSFSAPPPAQRRSTKQLTTFSEPLLEPRSDYSKVIRDARAKSGLSQEQLGRKINEKPSVIKLLESGKLKPDDHLARKIEHFLKITILTPPDEGL